MNKNIIRLTMLVISTLFISIQTNAQAVENCGMAAGSGGTVSSTMTDVCPPDIFFATLSGLGTPGGYFTEFVFFNPNDTVYNTDSLSSGPNILEVNTSGLFDPGAHGLTDGDQFGVQTITYDLAAVQSNTEKILHGSFIFTPCCLLAQLAAGFDVCQVWNDEGVINGSDVTSISQILGFLQNSTGGPGANSMEGVVFYFDTLNSNAGSPCTDDLPVCYATSDELIVDVDCGATCSSATPPTGLTSTPGATTVTLAWNPIAGSVGCQIKAHRLTPPGPNPSNNVLGMEPSSVTVPNSVFGAGTTWSWEVRCACTISPVIDATGFSSPDTFSIAALRTAVEPAEMQIYPNPASESVQLQFSNTTSYAQLELTDLSGRVLISQPLDLFGNDSRQLDVSGLVPGYYLIKLTDENGSLSQKLIIE